jgi:DNA-binding transcriptional regulator GbsR (MarR family)
MEYLSTHRKVIDTIHTSWSGGTPFAIWEIRNAAHVSTSSVIRVLRILMRLKLVSHTKRGHVGQHYRVTVRWPSATKDAIDAFEYARILKI